MIFQNFALFSSRTAGENIAYPMEICGTSKDKIEEYISATIELSSDNSIYSLQKRLLAVFVLITFIFAYSNEFKRFIRRFKYQ